MASERFGQVAKAVSGGLDLFIGREAEKERRAIDRQWAMALEELRESRSVAREERETKYREGRDTLETERYVAGQETARQAGAATADYRKDTLAQGAEQFDRKQVASAEESLFKRIDAAREAAAKELEEANKMMEEGAEERIMARTQQTIEEMISGHVVRLGSANAPGYEINDAGAMESKFIQLGMDPMGAKDRITQLGPMLWPDQTVSDAADPLFKPNPANVVRSTNAAGNDVYSQPGAPPVVAGAAQQDAGSAAAAIPPMQSQQPTPGSLQSIMQSGTILNPDGTPKYPSNKDSLGSRFVNWTKGPSNELFGAEGN